MADKATGFEAIEEVYEDRRRTALQFKNEGRPIMGYYCSYPPLEMITAMDYVPYRILGCGREPVTKADMEIPTVVCPFIRSSLDLAFKGVYDFLDGFVAAHTCDCEEKLFRVWKETWPVRYQHFIDLPHVVRDNALEQFKEKLTIFRKSLEVHTGKKMDHERLVREIGLHNRQRERVRELYGLRKQNPPLITGSEILKTMVALMSLPIEDGNHFLKDVIIRAGIRRQRPLEKELRIFLWGTPLTETNLIDIIEAFDAHVVMDDMCVGSRHFWADVEITEDPLDGLAARYLEGINCPRTIRDTTGDYDACMLSRFGHLKEFVTDWKADGVILQSMKYCDTHGYEVPELKGFFDSMGIPTLYIEHQYTASSEAQIKNRIEAFLENIP
ncbi:MAG: 2-hydroxyacyl-CoA dehydratase family protein [Desulfobacterales bacterium]